MAEPEESRPNCGKCKHYFITYDPAMPFGCRAFNFKCKQRPCIQVKHLSGQECELFQPKVAE